MVKKNYDQIIESQLISSDFFFSHVIESRTLLKILKNTSMHQAQGLNALCHLIFLTLHYFSISLVRKLRLRSLAAFSRLSSHEAGI